jgi:hypothetical protein
MISTTKKQSGDGATNVGSNPASALVGTNEREERERETKT